MDARRLRDAIRAAGVPVEDVSIGGPDRATWRVSPSTLQAQAQPVIDAYVAPTPAQMLDEQAQRDVSDKKLQAMAVALYECIPSPKLTKAQMKARAVEIYKTL